VPCEGRSRGPPLISYVRPHSLMSHTARIFLGAFLLAPVLPALMFAFFWARDGQFLRVLALTFVVAYGLILFVAVPTFFTLRISQRGATLGRVLISAFLVGAVPMALLSILAPPPRALSPWEIAVPILVGVLSLSGGAVFWLVARTVLKPTPSVNT